MANVGGHGDRFTDFGVACAQRCGLIGVSVATVAARDLRGDRKRR